VAGDSANNVPAGGRRNGQTYRDGWARARKVGPRFALAGSFNEWSNPNEEPSAEISKDIEPSHVFGMKYLDLLKKEDSVGCLQFGSLSMFHSIRAAGQRTSPHEGLLKPSACFQAKLAAAGVERGGTDRSLLAYGRSR
jgi:hypothetical protein